MIDDDGFRPNVGIVMTNTYNHVLWARRLGQDAWQFPQGGIKAHETPQKALERELKEELGLSLLDVEIMGVTEGWLRYWLPKHLIRQRSKPVCIGQKQKWFLLRLACAEQKIQLHTSAFPEFDSWRWVDYWYPVEHVVDFKRDVYRQALQQLESLLKESA